MTKVTVLMPVYNGQQYLRTAVESVLEQTYRDFEFLIIDDGSTDESPAILQSYNDPRIRIVTHTVNKRLIATLNEGIELASGEYIARMDADDYAFPRRLEQQVKAMDANPDLALCGTWYNEYRSALRSTHLPTQAADLKAELLFTCPLAHPSVMLRRSVLLEEQLRYDEKYPHAEDYELWSRMLIRHSATNLPEILLRYRHHEGQVSAVHMEAQKASMHLCQLHQLQRLGLHPDPEQAAVHYAISDLDFRPSLDWVSKAGDWLLLLWKTNQKTAVYEHRALHRLLVTYWYNICSSLHEKHVPVSSLFLKHPLATTLGVPVALRLKFGIKYQAGLWKLRQRQKH